MSGGPFGRGKAPQRACLKVVDWPARDRAVWNLALAPADPFQETGGSRATYAAISNVKIEKGYGRWLTWLTINGQLDIGEPPQQRITSNRVTAFVASLHEIGNGSQTVLARLQELREVARVLDPAADWSFINRIASRIRANATPVRDKRAKLAMTDELVHLGLTLMAEASSQSTLRRVAVDFRDGLLIAFLALRPLRRKNLSELILGNTLVRCEEGWSIRIPSMQTKTKAPIEVPWPDVLVGPLEDYLAVHRPVLMRLRSRWATAIGDALWVSADGSPMTQIALYDRIRQRTQQGLRKAVNPHLFRDAAATTLAVSDPVHVRLAASILGHRSFATTERYYQQAQSLEAHRQFTQLLDRLRANPGRATVGADAEVEDT